jgi:hypothetical protein
MEGYGYVELDMQAWISASGYAHADMEGMD